MAAMKSVRKIVKQAFERKFHVKVYSTRPHGRDDCNDIANSGMAIRTILDVGANDGSSSLKFHAGFPEALIHAFEPVSTTFETLASNVGTIQQIRCHQLAVGESSTTASIYVTQHSTTSSLIRPESSLREEVVAVTTVDAFAADQRLPKIDLLKIDTEGYDLNVLRGSRGMFAREAIHFVLVEVGFHRHDSRHVLFDDVRDLLEGSGFSVYGFYDQQLEWSGENRLRYANVCFAHASVAAMRSA